MLLETIISDKLTTLKPTSWQTDERYMLAHRYKFYKKVN